MIGVVEETSTVSGSWVISLYVSTGLGLHK